MELAYMHGKSAEREGIDVFGGLNARPVIADNEFSQMLNAGWQEYPCAAPRMARRFIRAARQPMGMIANKHLVWVAMNPNTWVANDPTTWVDQLYYYSEAPGNTGVKSVSLPLNTHVDRQMVNMGTRVCIFPDKVIFDTLDYSVTSMELAETAYASATVQICNENGTTPTNFSAGTAKPDTPAHNEYFYDTANKVLYIYDKFTNEWYDQPVTYIRINKTAIGTGLQPEDGVYMKYASLDSSTANGIIGIDESYGLVNIFKKATNYIVVQGLVDFVNNNTGNSTTATITLKRTVPAMDYVCEMGNRLWGCRYGLNNDGVFVNEIYASALGDPTNWQKFLGTSADSYIMSVGSSGKFTGIVNHLGYVMAFKEDIIHKVYGTRPSNFQLLDTKARGIAEGSERSACIIDETLYFMTPYDVVGMRAGLPTSVSEKINDLDLRLGVGGEYRRRYYLCCQTPRAEFETTKKHLFVFDPETGNWYREDARDVKYMAKCDNKLYMLMEMKPEDERWDEAQDKPIPRFGLFVVEDDGVEVYDGLTPYVENKDNIKWRYDSGLIGLRLPDHKYVSNIQIRLDALEGANVVVDVRFDNQDRDSERAGVAPGWGNGWHRSYRYDDMKNRQNIRVPIRTPPRCDTMQISIHGQGKVRLYSVVKTIEVSEEW